MDFRTPCQILLGVLLAAIAVSVLGLAADNVSYVNSHSHHSAVKVHYMRWNETAQGQYSYWVTMDYVPSRFSMGTMNAMLAACVITGLVGTAVAVGTCMTRGKKALETSFSLKKRSAPFLPTALVLTTIAFLTSLAVAIYVWHTGMRYPSKFQDALPLPPHTYTTLPPHQAYAAAPNGQAIYQSSFDFTPEIWNCFLAPYVVNAKQSQRMAGVCREAGAARYLMLPMLILSAALLSCLGWSWRKAHQAAVSDADNGEVKEVEEISVHSKN